MTINRYTINMTDVYHVTTQCNNVGRRFQGKLILYNTPKYPTKIQIYLIFPKYDKTKSIFPKVLSYLDKKVYK